MTSELARYALFDTDALELTPSQARRC
jgi:hypothetical protein